MAEFLFVLFAWSGGGYGILFGDLAWFEDLERKGEVRGKKKRGVLRGAEGVNHGGCDSESLLQAECIHSEVILSRLAGTFTSPSLSLFHLSFVHSRFLFSNCSISKQNIYLIFPAPNSSISRLQRQWPSQQKSLTRAGSRCTDTRRSPFPSPRVVAVKMRDWASGRGLLLQCLRLVVVVVD
jgi:hypothetical protein